MWKKMTAAVMTVLMLCQLTACGASSTDDTRTTEVMETGTQKESITQDETDTSGNIVTNLEKIDMSKWMYHSDDNVYYQIGISYCKVPADSSYETLAVNAACAE